MAIGFPAFYKDRKDLLTSKAEAKEKAIKVLEKLNCKEIGLHPFALDYQTMGTILTSGERFYVNITDSEIIVRSECLFFTRIFDFGKNKANIEEFWLAFEAEK